MIQFKEFCCGCTLRTGALIILWSTLVLDSLRSLSYFGKIIYDPKYSYFGDLPLVTLFFDIIFLTACCFGMAVATFGIYGIQQNRPEFLNLCYYYYVGYFGYWLFVIFMLIIKPSSFYYVTMISPFHFLALDAGPGHGPAVVYFVIVYVVGYIFLSVFTLYVALIIKSCKETMINNREEGKDPEIPDPAALGYSASF